MAQRLYRLEQRTQATRLLLGWFAVAATATVLAAIAACDAHAAPAEPQGLMLRPGNWTQGRGSYQLPAALDRPPAQWPLDGWYRVISKPGVLQVEAVAAPARGLPTFLRDVAVQVVDPDGDIQPPTGESEAESIDTRYIRVSGVKLSEGRQPTVRFSNVVLRPEVGHTYDLRLGETPFQLTVHNGQRTPAGTPYGQGARYEVRVGGETYSYLIGRNAFDSTVHAVADLDGDARPDFIVRSGRQELLLLSSRAVPGRNAPTATLESLGDH